MKKINIDDFAIDQIAKEYFLQYFEENKIEVLLEFSSDFKNTKYLREVISIFLEILGVSAVCKGRFVLIVDELSNNAIEHGSSEKDVLGLFFKGYKTQEGVNINIEVMDTGNSLKAKKAFEMEEMRQKKLLTGFGEHKSIRGRGLFLIITKIVDELYFKDNEKGGLTIGVKKNIPLEG